MENTRVEDLRNILKEKGIQPSYHRLKILKYLMENKVHPTVDMIYRGLSAEIPTLSKTTIYNTLNLFAEKGLVAVLTIGERETRYDINVQPHAHFKCESCGRVYDLWDVKLDVSGAVPEGFEISRVELYIKGICANCRKGS